MNLTYSLDVASLVLLVIIGSFQFDKRRSETSRYRLYNLALIFTAFTVVFDILSALGVNHIDEVPFIWNYLASMLYFVFLFCCFSTISLYVYYLLYERISKKGFHKVLTYLIISGTIMQVLVLTNYWTGFFFSFENGLYHRGLFNKLPYLLVLANMALYYFIYFTHRQEAGSSQHQLMRILTPTFICMGSAQLLFPDTLMVGLLITVLNLILYVNSQNSRLGQDSLTDLPFRQLFFSRIHSPQYATIRQHVIMVYFENLQELNHRYGISATDDLIFRIARQLELFAPEYEVFRFSNTRFLLVSNYMSFSRSELLPTLILDRFNKPWEIENDEAMVHIHVAHMDFMPAEYEDDMLIDQLEYTLNVAKATGDNNSVIAFNEHYRTLYYRNQYLLKEIQYAIDHKTFDVYYQPIYSQMEHKYVAAEALIRLHDTEGNYVSPADFIPLAEDNGLLKDITWIVVEKVCQFIEKNPEISLRTISINVSSEIITDIHFLTHFRSLLAQYRVPPNKLKLEITERTISSKPQLVKSVMSQLDSEGIGFSLDDFGTGYSNFEAILTMPFQTIKLDRSIMKHIDTDERYCTMVALIVNMLNAGHLEIVAEGLETESQIEISKKLNLDYIQGYYYAKPMPAHELAIFLHEKIVPFSLHTGNMKHA